MAEGKVKITAYVTTDVRDALVRQAAQDVAEGRRKSTHGATSQIVEEALIAKLQMKQKGEE